MMECPIASLVLLFRLVLLLHQSARIEGRGTAPARIAMALLSLAGLPASA